MEGGESEGMAMEEKGRTEGGIEGMRRIRDCWKTEVRLLISGDKEEGEIRGGAQ